MAKKQRRRGDGEGTIDQRPDGIWRARVSLGFSPDGKRRRKDIYGKTKAEVQKKTATSPQRQRCGKIAHSDENNSLGVLGVLDCKCQQGGDVHKGPLPAGYHSQDQSIDRQSEVTATDRAAHRQRNQQSCGEWIVTQQSAEDFRSLEQVAK